MSPPASLALLDMLPGADRDLGVPESRHVANVGEVGHRGESRAAAPAALAHAGSGAVGPPVPARLNLPAGSGAVLGGLTWPERTSGPGVISTTHCRGRSGGAWPGRLGDELVQDRGEPLQLVEVGGGEPAQPALALGRQPDPGDATVAVIAPSLH